VKGQLQGEEQLRRDVEDRLALTPTSFSDTDLDAHLKNLTPPISRLTALVPQALDRLGQGAMLSILGGPDSGRMHLAEAVELSARVYCGRSTEQIREQPGGGARGDEDDLRAQQPGHLCILDLTRPKEEDEQIERLEAFNQGGAGPAGQEPPALLVVREGPLPKSLAFLRKGWNEEELIQLPAATAEDAREAYLIGTDGAGSLDRRRAEFTRLADEYERRHEGVPIGLRAASSAATIAVEQSVSPRVSDLPGPPSRDFEFSELAEEDSRLAESLAWFGNRPFDLEDARWATGDAGLSESEIFGIATKIPGGRKIFELRPQLVADAGPPDDTHSRMCEYLISCGPEFERIVERWPGRALRILDEDSVEVGGRLELGVALFETCRDQGLARELARAMKKLRGEAGDRMDERLARFEIERARLLTHLGEFEQADAALSVVTASRKRSGEWIGLKARAHLRRAICASRLGEVERAGREAKKASRSSQLGMKVENFHGWEAMHTANFELAVERFERALDLGGDSEERADAVVGLSRALIRMGRLKPAEEALAELDDLDLRRHTRDRVARVRGSVCDVRGDPLAGIDRYIDPALLNASSNYSSASALLLEASAFLHLEAGEVNAAAEDMSRSRSVLANAGGRQSSATHYVQALIYKAKAEEARGQVARDLLGTAREHAEQCLGTDIERNAWARARAHTLLARLALQANDREALAQSLASAVAAHRELGFLCPGVLCQTLDLGAEAAATWRMREIPDRIRALVTDLEKEERLPALDLDATVSVLDGVIERIEAGPPPAEPPERGDDLRVLGRVGGVIEEGSERLKGSLGGLQIQVLIPRTTTDGPAEGLYDVSPVDGGLLRVVQAPPRAVELIAPKGERRLVKRYAAAVLLISAPPGDDRAAYLSLGEWVAGFKVVAREAGIAAIESIALDRDRLDALHETPRITFAVALAEMSVLA
jgi:tetratricopeptide (TPR) repeat protein